MQFKFQTGITSWGIECGKKDVPGVYADVQKGLCFIDYATRCGLGFEAEDYKSQYGLSNCANWAADRYCDILKEVEQKSELVISFVNRNQQPILNFHDFLLIRFFRTEKSILVKLVLIGPKIRKYSNLF